MFHKQGEEILAGTKEQQHRENPAFQAGGGLGSTHRIQLSEPGAEKNTLPSYGLYTNPHQDRLGASTAPAAFGGLSHSTFTVTRHEGRGDVTPPGSGAPGGWARSRVHCLPRVYLTLEKPYKQLALKTPDKNVIFSPLSVSMAWLPVPGGPRHDPDGDPRRPQVQPHGDPRVRNPPGFQHLLHTLGHPAPAELSVGNANVVQEQLKLLDKFRTTPGRCTRPRSPPSTPDPDTAKSLINDYVKNKTQGKVVDLFKRLTHSQKWVLVNYIYFKAKWKLPFDPQVTNQAEFHVSENRSVEVPMMRIPSLVTPMFRDAVLGCVVVELQYTSNDSALFILPDEGRLEEVEAKLLPETLRRVHCLPEGVLDLEKVTQEDQHREASVDNFTLASSNTNFAFSLYKQLALKTPDKNVIFSPLSVSMALAFLSLGARGTTLTEILEGLKFNLTETPESEIHQGFQHLLQTLGQPSNQLQLSVGNAMFVQEQLKLLDKFRDDARALYAAEVSSINFRDPDTAKSLINDYVKNKTQGKVVDLFKRLDPLTEVVLVNYIYFKAKWKLPFDPQVTNQAEFHVSENRSVEVPMMRIPSLVTPMFRDRGRLEEVEASCLRDTEEVERTHCIPGDLPSLIDELGLPKFSISSDYDLKDILPQLGIREVFTDKADLSGVNDSNDLKVTQVVHKAVLDVGEEGTEGFASTGISVETRIMKTITVYFNRPFLLTIVHRDTQSVIFLGKVTDPSQA
ncbi:Serpin A3-8 [Camelus dromedarius]|uniref:Serpin A3-8 n=1 Tax=Camelus dromedarius TaxID=9838 RepID=A0A5N4E308_CAMDR|nr:Serpin A3-8 [Camelus dromedarius]